jgi:hypothetical protein
MDDIHIKTIQAKINSLYAINRSIASTKHMIKLIADDKDCNVQNHTMLSVAVSNLLTSQRSNNSAIQMLEQVLLINK